MYKKYCELRDSLKLKDSDVAKASGIAKSTFSDWKSGRSTPKPDKVQKIADALGVPTSYFYADGEEYYIDPDVNALAQEMANRPGMKTLFEASRDLSEEDLQIVNQLILKLTDKK